MDTAVDLGLTPQALCCRPPLAGFVEPFLLFSDDPYEAALLAPEETNAAKRVKDWRKKMATQSPEDVHLLFAEYFSAGDLDRLLSLYESDAAFVPRTGAVVNGQAEIRESLAGFLERKGEMELQVRRTVRADDLALLLSDWTIYRTSPSGRDVESSGRTADVVRRQSDGRWLIVIDNPHCNGELS